MLFTKDVRKIAPGLIVLDPQLPASLKQRNPLATAWQQLDAALWKTKPAASFSRLENLTDS